MLKNQPVEQFDSSYKPEDVTTRIIGDQVDSPATLQSFDRCRVRGATTRSGGAGEILRLSDRRGIVMV